MCVRVYDGEHWLLLGEELDVHLGNEKCISLNGAGVYLSHSVFPAVISSAG